MLYKIYLVLLLTGTSLYSWGQAGLTHLYSMDDCTMSDSRGQADGIFFGANPCTCGVSSNGLRFDGNIQFAEFDSDLNTTLGGDWSMSFYIRVENGGTESVDILYLGESCSLDSVLSLRYLPGTKRFRFLLSDSPNNEILLDGLADANSCWQYLVITKEGATARMYVNGTLTSEDAAVSNLNLNVNSVLSISNSPCQNLAVNADVKFQGSIDEFKLYNRVLTEREVQDFDLQPDQILTSDTTIFQGESIRIITGGSCESSFQWTPSEFLDDPSALNPIASPVEDMTYTLTVNGDDCQSVDMITIRVADRSELTCEDLILPSGFTPNNDRINDQIGISNGFLISNLQSFEIFNRWGGRVFFTNDVLGKWDGFYQGKEAPATSYLYKVTYTCNNDLYQKTGAINLIR